MKNIAILLTSLNSGGAERIGGLLAKELSRYYNVYLMLLSTENMVYEYGGQVVDLAIDGMENVKSNIEKYKKAYQIECAISFLEPMNFVNILTKNTETVIISERCALSPQQQPLQGEIAKLKRLYNYADKIISVSYGVQYDLINNYGVNEKLTETIYNFINKKRIIEKSKDQLDEDIVSFIGNSKMLLHVGRMDKQKNHRKLLVQFSKLVHERKDVKLVIKGSGSLKDEISKWIDELNLQGLVKIVSYDSNPFSLYRMATMLVLSSDYEGLPNVILEAMLFGLPVVAVDCLAGPKELLKESHDYESKISGYEVCKNGVLVEQVFSDEIGDTNYLEDAIGLLLDNNELRQQISYNEFKYMQKYTNEMIVKQWIDVIESTKSNNICGKDIRIPELDGCKKLILYGAGEIGKLVLEQFLPFKESYELFCFAVTNKNDNQQQVFGIPVYEITELIKYKEEAMVLVTVSALYENEVINILKQYGFKYTFPNV